MDHSFTAINFNGSRTIIVGIQSSTAEEQREQRGTDLKKIVLEAQIFFIDGIAILLTQMRNERR